MSNDDDLYDRKNLILFGTNVAEIPCFRSSLLYGIGGGFVGGFSIFLFTSKVRLASHLGYGAFVATSLVCWVRCRYQFSQQKFNMNQIQEAYKEYSRTEGSGDVKDI